LHFLDRLGAIIDADAAVKGEMADCLAGRNVDLGVVFWSPGGFSPPPCWHEHLERFRDDPGYSPVMCEYHRLTLRDRGRAFTREDFVEDCDWYGSHDFVKIFEPLGLDAGLYSFRPIPGVEADESTGFLLCRKKGRRDFSPRQRTIAQEAHAAISPHVGRALARFADPSPMDLPPRARQVLACLLEGDGDKQVADRLGIGVHTVNQYTKAVFRHFAVRSRAELLARWVRRGWCGRFSWAEWSESFPLDSPTNARDSHRAPNATRPGGHSHTP
jgi:DNA-binding CsgD family transcriptional regulator